MWSSVADWNKAKKGKRRKEICKWQLHLNKAQYPQLAFQKTTPQTVNRR